MDIFYDKLNMQIRDRFLKLERRIRKNEYIAGFYESLWTEWVQDYAQHWGLPSVVAQADLENALLCHPYEKHVYKSAYQVANCSRWYETEYYRLQSVKDVKRVYTCNNKFCEVCQSALAQQRYEKFAPVLDVLSVHHNIAHVVLTVPNCDFANLKIVLDNMYEQRKMLMRYLTSHAKIKGVDFKKYGYQGAVIALEITKSERDGKAHPHFHCVFVFDKNRSVFGRRVFTNSYSFSNEDVKKSHKKDGNIRLFNQFEILLQKIWYLRINHIEVTKERIEGLKEGYSCIVDRADKFHEVFKYATKGVIKWSEDRETILSCYSDFVHTDYALYRRRMIQAYGCLRKIPIPEELDQSAENDELYLRELEKLRYLESPIAQRESLAQILEEQEKYKHIKYISRKNVQAILGNQDEET